MASDEVQEPIVRSQQVGFDWNRSPRFPDVRGALTDAIRSRVDDEDNWTWQAGGPFGPMVAAWSSDETIHLIVHGAGFSAVEEDAAGDNLANACRALPDCLEALAVDAVTDCDAGLIWLLSAPERSVAVEFLERALGHERLRERSQPLGGKPDHARFRLGFGSSGEVQTYAELDALDAEELSSGNYFLGDYEPADFPPAAVCARIWRQQEVDKLAGAEAQEQAFKHLESVRTAGARFLEGLLD